MSEINWDTSTHLDQKYAPEGVKYFKINATGNAQKLSSIDMSEFSAEVGASLEKMVDSVPGVYSFVHAPKQAQPAAPVIDHAAIYASRGQAQPAAKSIDHASIYASRRYQ
jgi:hypothetical protein